MPREDPSGTVRGLATKRRRIERDREFVLQKRLFIVYADDPVPAGPLQLSGQHSTDVLVTEGVFGSVTCSFLVGQFSFPILSARIAMRACFLGSTPPNGRISVPSTHFSYHGNRNPPTVNQSRDSRRPRRPGRVHRRLPARPGGRSFRRRVCETGRPTST